MESRGFRVRVQQCIGDSICFSVQGVDQGVCVTCLETVREPQLLLAPMDCNLPLPVPLSSHAARGLLSLCFSCGKWILKMYIPLSSRYLDMVVWLLSLLFYQTHLSSFCLISSFNSFWYCNAFSCRNLKYVIMMWYNQKPYVKDWDLPVSRHFLYAYDQDLAGTTQVRHPLSIERFQVWEESLGLQMD